MYNQETWRQVTRGQGKELVERYMPQMVAFYVNQSEADNHAVREAACACIAELGSKVSLRLRPLTCTDFAYFLFLLAFPYDQVNKDAVRPFISQLLDALLVCFNDDSWPVRDGSEKKDSLSCDCLRLSC